MMVTFNLYKRGILFNSRIVFIELYLPCYGTMELPSPIVFYALVDVVIRFFDNDLSVLKYVCP